MKRGLIIAAAVTPILAAATGVAIARFTQADAGEVGGRCTEPTLLIDMAEGASLITGGPNSLASCEGDTCTVRGPETVEVQADGRVRCAAVNDGQTLALTRRDDGLSIIVQETGR